MRKKERKTNEITGRLSCNAKGSFGFVINDDEDGEDVYVNGRDMLTALDGDTVLVKTTFSKATRRKEGKVIKVEERGNKTIVGVVYDVRDGYFCVRPDSRKIYTKVLVAEDERTEAKIGDRVVVGSLEYSEKGDVFGDIESILGDEHSLKSLTDSIIISNNIKSEFDERTMREADKTPKTVTKKQREDREDLRDKLIFTIDGDDSKDFDDAVSIEKLKNGHYMLGVHIADVSEYVKEGSALNSEAYERGTSVYLADRVIPMLPEALSNGICSLNPNVDRLTLTCFMEIDKTGKIKNYRIVKSLIRSKERMTYNNVNKLLEGGDKELTKRYEHLLPTLADMKKLADILYNKRVKRGAVMFEFPECRVIMNDKGEPEDIVKEVRGESQKMIEEFMLAANETVAEHAYWKEVPFVYRSHEPPSEDKINGFNRLLLRFNLQITEKHDENNPIKPMTMQTLLKKVEGEPYERAVSTEMLRSMMKAKYTPDNLGHFGLAAKYYCHFTSPIRRYPDLVVHRILKKMIAGEPLDKIKGFVGEAANHSSDAEITAETTERDVDDLMKAAYMSQFVGKDFDAVISGVTSYGIYVELDNTVEGLIRVENLTDDYYEYDENTGILKGRRKGFEYSLGDSIRVVLARCDIMARQIDFVLEENASETLRKFLPKKEQRKERPSGGRKKGKKSSRRGGRKRKKR